jgi:Zn-dependent protease
MVAYGGLAAVMTRTSRGNRLLGRGLRLGRILGVPVRLDLTWFIGLAIFTTLSHDVWSPRVTGLAAVALSVLFTCAFFTSVLAHELSHALAARVLGIGTMEISLLVFGGVARIVSEPADAAGEALMAMAGPLTSVSIAGLLWLCSQFVGGWPGDLIALLGLANLVLAAFNLLPGFPLDGGRVARAVVWRLTGRRLLATTVTAWFGRGLALLLIAGGGVAVVVLHTPRYLLHVALGLFLWNAASQGERAARQVEHYTPRDAFIHPEP